uniref:Uncharacterized protein n=1 Tax=Cannabis sativa TaxID=3483 RepID=A0A803NTE7_CANSA
MPTVKDSKQSSKIKLGRNGQPRDPVTMVQTRKTTTSTSSGLPNDPMTTDLDVCVPPTTGGSTNLTNVANPDIPTNPANLPNPTNPANSVDPCNTRN